jgi:nitric oxide reductase NorQ protein
MAQAAAAETRGDPGPQGVTDHIGARQGGDVVHLRPREDLFEDQMLASLQSRSLAYLRAGVPIHLCGPAGTGKTTLAIQIAALLGRPAILLTGDARFTSGHLTGRETGQRTKQVVDRFIHSVKKVESQTETLWSDDVLTNAIVNGYTLVYDEFTRSPPEANNPLLMAFEERMLILPGGQRGERYVRAHPDFRAIMTSNPSDYAGVTTPQDALIDRMVTFDLDEHDRDTEIGIVANRSRLAKDDCAVIVDLVRNLRRCGFAAQHPSLRSAILIAKIAAAESMAPSQNDAAFTALCRDVLQSKAARPTDPQRRAAFFNALEAELAPKTAKRKAA